MSPNITDTQFLTVLETHCYVHNRSSKRATVKQQIGLLNLNI